MPVSNCVSGDLTGRLKHSILLNLHVNPVQSVLPLPSDLAYANFPHLEEVQPWRQEHRNRRDTTESDGIWPYTVKT